MNHQVRVRPARTTVFVQGEVDDEMYIILSGKVQVSIRLETGDSKFVREMGPGEYFGELALLDDSPRSATVTTVTDCRFLTIRKAAFRQALVQHPELALRIIRGLIRLVHESNKHLDDAKPVRERLREVLASMCGDQRGVVTIEVTRQELADRCGARRETISRELASLADARVIALKGRSILVRTDRL